MSLTPTADVPKLPPPPPGFFSFVACLAGGLGRFGPLFCQQVGILRPDFFWDLRDSLARFLGFVTPATPMPRLCSAWEHKHDPDDLHVTIQNQGVAYTNGRLLSRVFFCNCNPPKKQA